MNVTGVMGHLLRWELFHKLVHDPSYVCLKYRFDMPPPHELCKKVLSIFSPIASHRCLVFFSPILYHTLKNY